MHNRIDPDASLLDGGLPTVRAELAARALAPAAMLLANTGGPVLPDTIAEVAVDIADALIVRLNSIDSPAEPS